ncbi:Peptidase family M23 [Polaribacter sp. KT 15]|nr:Peptidase family M23 [Polaribacter sp. KT 15]
MNFESFFYFYFMKLNPFESFLKNISETPLLAIDKKIHLSSYVPINISNTNKDLLSFDVSSSNDWENYIEAFLKKENKHVAYGGYLEKRNLYDRSAYFKNLSEEDKRNIHLGIDLWCKEKTKVLAVLKGKVHSFNFNKNHGDYGPTIILEHKIADYNFYTLYGHLSENSIQNLKVGDKFNEGEVIAELGNATVNGDYAPHLHFQIIKNLQGNKGDYPGVSSSKDLDFYKENCPNPNLLLKIKD